MQYVTPALTTPPPPPSLSFTAHSLSFPPVSIYSGNEMFHNTCCVVSLCDSSIEDVGHAPPSSWSHFVTHGNTAFDDFDPAGHSHSFPSLSPHQHICVVCPVHVCAHPVGHSSLHAGHASDVPHTHLLDEGRGESPCSMVMSYLRAWGRIVG